MEQALPKQPAAAAPSLHHPLKGSSSAPGPVGKGKPNKDLLPQRCRSEAWSEAPAATPSAVSPPSLHPPPEHRGLIHPAATPRAQQRGRLSPSAPPPSTGTLWPSAPARCSQSWPCPGPAWCCQPGWGGPGVGGAAGGAGAPCPVSTKERSNTATECRRCSLGDSRCFLAPSTQGWWLLFLRDISSPCSSMGRVRLYGEQLQVGSSLHWSCLPSPSPCCLASLTGFYGPTVTLPAFSALRYITCSWDRGGRCSGGQPEGHPRYPEGSQGHSCLLGREGFVWWEPASQTSARRVRVHTPHGSCVPWQCQQSCEEAGEQRFRPTSPHQHPQKGRLCTGCSPGSFPPAGALRPSHRWRAENAELLPHHSHCMEPSNKKSENVLHHSKKRGGELSPEPRCDGGTGCGPCSPQTQLTVTPAAVSQHEGICVCSLRIFKTKA